jgi:hypothetical protein
MTRPTSIALLKPKAPCQQISQALKVESAAKLDALLPSILDKAFKGEL